jgi:hypothetical protein
MNEQNTKTIKLMRFWLFGTFIIVFAAVTSFAAITPGVGLAILAEVNYWLIIGLTAVLCIGGAFGYEWWLKRKAG